jgi:peroxiredoxin
LNEAEKHGLPIPATYVVGRDGIVRYVFVNPDDTQRAEPSKVLDVIVSLNKGV